ncbi:MAG: hypothetical protein Ct9H300mP6_17470 [Gammaproteobacteria bacterium]|nr:MAG: hypothetical protein Ct9H300mP6_17470 [Gammaproteobacteria bacterium]
MKAIQKEYELERDNLDKTIPNCKYLSRLDAASDVMTIGYAKKLLLDLKKRMSIKQINKAKKLAEEIKKERA